MALAQSLANHAAIALENARLFEDAQRALHELQVANDVIRRQNEGLERAAALHERLANVVLDRGALADVAGAAADALDGRLVVFDAHRRVVAVAGVRGSTEGTEPGPPGPDDGPTAGGLSDAFDRALTSARSVEVQLLGGHRLVVAVRGAVTCSGSSCSPAPPRSVRRIGACSSAPLRSPR